MTELAVLIPALDRPHRVKPVLESVQRTVPDARVIFVCSPGDAAQLAAVAQARRTDCLVIEGGYAAKINAAVRRTWEPLLFFGADDLDFHDGWFEKAKARLTVDGAQVVGVNDLCSERVRRGTHATHFLVTRKYALEPLADGHPGPLCEIYDHSCVDDEFWATAAYRGVLTVASDAVVEHLHPDVRKAEWDATYDKGRRLIRQDRRRLYQRRPLWT